MSEQNIFAVIVCDNDGIIRHWNTDAEQLFGHAADEACGQSLDLIVPEEFRDAHWAGFRRVVESGTMKLDRATLNVPVKHKNGTVEAYPGRFVFLQGPRDEVAGVAVIYSPRQGNEEPFGEVLPL